MSSARDDTDELIRRALGGDEDALAALFDRHRERLRRMVRLRLDRRLTRRIDPSDILQEAYLALQKRLPEYAQDPALPFFLWLRPMTGQTLADVHRFHLKAKRRDAGCEVSLRDGPVPGASSASLTAHLLGKLTSASRAAIRAEVRVLVREAIDRMDDIDREVLSLRHFEHLSNDEAALVLGISPSAASNRYLRALKRLKPILSSIPGLQP